MRTYPWIRRWLGATLAVAVLSSCTAYNQIEEGLYLHDTLPPGQARGYAEFRLDPVIRNAPEFDKQPGTIWIFWEKEYAESTIKRRPFDLTARQSVRFALPPGTQLFFIGTAFSGHRNVPVEIREGQVTAVLVRVVGQTARRTSGSTTISGEALTTTTITTGVTYDWVTEYQVSKPVALDARR